ncbi:MAG: RICIN domain-containing protein [Alistipes sp.]|nr:RICIN domain-containing protein [Alistipes sp.]
MKKLLTTLLASCMLISATAQSVTTASSSMTASPWAVRVPYDISEEGTKYDFTFGMGGWSWDFFAYQQRNHCGKENLGIARVGFTGRYDASYTELTAAQKATMDGELNNIVQTGVKSIFLLCGIGNLGDQQGDAPGTPTWSTTQRENYVNDIVRAVEYIQGKGYEIFAVAPFNEPDFEKTYTGNASNFNAVAAIMKSKLPTGMKIFGPSTLNSSEAPSWYSTVKGNIDYANTHQLAGEKWSDYIGFWDQAYKDGKLPVADEMHNVMEAMVCINHGGVAGTWWGWEGITRGEYIRMIKGGTQLAYKEQPDKWMVASVNKYPDNGRVEAFIGTSERQAVASNFTFVSRDRLAYYDGHGPAYDYTEEVPGGASGSYQNGQTNAERLINISTGEDVPIEPVNGKYKIVNKATGKVLSLEGGNASARGNVYQWTDGGLANQVWDVYPVDKTVAADYSYVVIRNSNTSTLNLYLDAQAWAMESGANVSVWADNYDSSCQPNVWERWYLRYVGDGCYHVINHFSGLYLAVDGGNAADGANVVEWENDGTDKLLWKFVPAEHAVDATAPTTPTGLVATSQSGAVKLTWAASVDEDIFGYMVYRYNAAVGIWECIGRKVQGTAFLDNTCRKGQPLRYRIRALDKAYNLSEPSAEVETKTASDNALVAQWIGQSIKDNTPNKMHAAANGVTYTTDSEHLAFSFDGTDDYLKLPYHAGDMKEMTFAAWVKGGSTTAWQRIFDFGNGEDEYLFLTPTNGSAMRFEIKKDGVTQGLNATTTLGTGTWKHVAVTIGANEVAIYIDGVKNASTTSITLRPSDIAPAMNYLGRSQFDADPAFKGMMSDVRLYNYALSAEEVKNISSEIVSVDGLDITAERIPSIADNVSNWTVSGSWSTWTSTADGSGLSSPYVRIGTNGTSRISKTLNYLPEGIYTLSASCMSYYKYFLSERDVTGVTFFANDQSITVNTKSNKAAKTLSTTASLTDVSNTLEFGINANSTNATILAMDNVTLVYQGTAAEYIEGIENITYEMTSEASALTGKLMSAATKQALLDALGEVESTLVNFTSKIASGTSAKTDADAWIAAMEAVESAVANAKISVEAYAALGAQITASRAKAARYPQETCGSIDEFGLADIYTKCVNGEYLDEEISAIVIEVKGLTNRYMMTDAVVYATADNPIDVTELVMGHASFENNSYAPDWVINTQPTALGYDCIEFFEMNFDMYQTLYQMPAGTYRFETRGFYRYGGQATNKTGHDQGTLKRNAKLYISHSEGSATADVMAISDDPSEIHLWGSWSAELYDGNPVPNDMQSASEAIDVRGKYQPKDGYNSVSLAVTTEGDLTLGAKKTSKIIEDWTLFGDFSLYYLGDGKRRIVLDEKSEVAPTIDESITYDEVTLKRTLKAGVWNTFVSPFAIPANMLGDWEVKELTHSAFNGEVLSLTFDVAPNGIKAGIPYMVRNMTMADDLTELKMNGVQLCATPQEVTTPEGHVTFTGVYHYGPMPEGAFFISNNTFYQIPRDGDDTNNNKSKAFRAYLMPQGAAAEARALSYRTDGVVDEDDNGTSVDSATGGVTVVAIYNTQGERLTDLQDGINILQMSDGTTMKVVIK